MWRPSVGCPRLYPGLFPWFAKHWSICWLGVEKGGGTKRALLTHDVFQPGCLFSLRTQLLFTWIKDGKINNNTMQTGTCKIPTKGMTVPRPVAPVLPSILFLPLRISSALPNPYHAPPARKQPQPPAAYLKSGQWNQSFPSRTSSRKQDEGGAGASPVPLALCMMWLLHPLLCIPLDTAATSWFSS